jgi:IclR family KDG regulon transcriptional repressor
MIQSVDRALSILELFGENSPELGVKEISTCLSLSKSTIHGLLKTLKVRGYLDQNPENQKYKLGLRIFELGNLVANQLDIKQVAYPVIKKLAEKLNETIHLAVLYGKEVLYVEKFEGPGALRMYSHVGKRAPINCTGVGKAILAFLEEETIQSILTSTDFIEFTTFTMTKPDEILRNLAEIRMKGYAMDDEEIELGLRCIATPIFNHENKVVASISCAGPKFRISNNLLDEMAEKIKSASIEISKKLGWKKQS